MRTLPRITLATLVTFVACTSPTDNDNAGESSPPLVNGWAVAQSTDPNVLAVAAHEDGWLIAAMPISSRTDHQGFNNVGAVLLQKPGEADILVWIGDDGLPRRALLAGVVVSFANWTSTAVDIGLIGPNGEIQVHRGVPLPASAAAGVTKLRSLAVGRTLAALEWGAREWLKVAATAVDVASCGVAAAAGGLTFGAAGVITAITCGTSAIQIAVRWTEVDDPALQLSIDALGVSLGAYGCATSSLGSCLSSVVELSTMAGLEAADAVLARNSEIELLEDALTNGGGEVQVTLTWDTGADIDLWVTDPAGERIYFRHPTSASGGQLDRDDTDGLGPENVFWPANGAPSGTYRVEVNHYSGTSPTHYTLLIQAFGQIKRYSGVISTNQTVMVATFTSGQPLPMNKVTLITEVKGRVSPTK